MASTAWVGTGNFQPGEIVPGFNEEAVFGGGSLAATGALSGSGTKTAHGSPSHSPVGELSGSGSKEAHGGGSLAAAGALSGSGADDPFDFTALIGSPGSNPGNIIPGLGAISIVLTTPSVAGGDLYRVQVFDFTTNFGVGDLIAEFDRPHAVGIADYLNNVPEAFFSLHQDDPKTQLLRGKEGRVHVRILRFGEVCWAGWALLERDANPADVVIYCYGYLAGLFWSHTDWKQEFEAATVGTIVADMWTRAKSGLSRSRLAWIGTGTIESPPTTAGGSTAITLPIYEAYRKRILFLMQEMAAISASDTGNSTTFEITHSANPVFNFWTNRRQDLNRVAWEWGDGRVQSFRDYGMPVYHRNTVYAVGQQPRDLLLQKTVEDTDDQTLGNGDWGRMEEALFFPWVRDEAELTRVAKLRAAKALREDVSLILTFFPHAEPPPNTSQSRWKMGDTAQVRINRGITNIDTRMQIVGYMTVASGGIEQTRVMLQEPV